MSFAEEKLRSLLLKQKYQLYGKNTAVKKCNWAHNALKDDKYCYKRFYGIHSHRCVQFSPTLICNFSCQFCWRVHESDIGIKNMYTLYDANDKEKMEEIFDSPQEVVKGILWGQRRIMCGYKPFVQPEKYEEAMNPRHATMSLTGEPFLYPWIPELIEELRKNKMSVFIVTNGSVPKVMQDILDKKQYPTQLYVTLPAPDMKDFLRTHRPLEKQAAFSKIIETLEIIGKGVPFRTVARLTVADGYNLGNPEGYSKLIEIMKPSFIEVKGVVHVGAAEKRLPRSAMPSHDKIREFALELESLTGYKLVRESRVSRLVILSNGSEPLLAPELEADADKLPQE
ncbi:MAG: 4-demethylwyosine synthase TYW1 [Candidatus Hodarchaeales archaeon]